MHLDATNDRELERYLKIKDYFFFENPGMAEGFYLEVRPSYHEALIIKDSNWHCWNLLLSELKNFPDIFRIRDMFYDLTHAFKAIVYLDNTGQNGLIFYVNFLDNLIGYYYAYGDTTLNKVPLRPYMAQDELLTMSYQPFTDVQNEMRARISENIKKLFPMFEEFNNKWANYKIEGAVTPNGMLKNVDLFQLIFDTNIHGII